MNCVCEELDSIDCRAQARNVREESIEDLQGAVTVTGNNVYLAYIVKGGSFVR